MRQIPETGAFCDITPRRIANYVYVGVLTFARCVGCDRFMVEVAHGPMRDEHQTPTRAA